jgi:putative membrane protein
MKRASQYFTDEEKKEIADAVLEAESLTSAEIVPVAATCSGRYDRAEDIIGVFSGIIVMIVVWTITPNPDTGTSGSWSDAPVALFLAISVIVGFIIGAVIGSKIGWLRKLFTPRSELSNSVKNKAALTFFDQRIHHTSSDSGMLLYISFFERQAVIMGDERVEKELGIEAIESLCSKLTQSLSDGARPAESMIIAINEAGELLSEVLPQSATEQNELAEALVCID